MDNILFKSYIESRAKEFDVNPNLLTHCFTGIILEKTEYEVLHHYIHYMAGEIFKGATANSNSENSDTRQTSAYLLEEVDQRTIISMNDPLYEYLAIGKYFDLTQPVTGFQYVAYLNAIEDIKKILLYNTEGLSGKGFLSIVQYLFADDIEKFKDFARLFDKPIKPN